MGEPGEVGGKKSPPGEGLPVEGKVLPETAPGRPPPDPTRGNDRNIGDHPHACGDVDELSLYSRALTADEIKALFSADALGKCKS